MTDFQDGDIIITQDFAVKVTKTGRGWFAEVCDEHHPLNGLLCVFGDKWFVVGALVEKARAVMTEFPKLERR
jgi:hypothetical protein